MKKFILLSSVLLAGLGAQGVRAESQIHDHGTGFVNQAAELDAFFKSVSAAKKGEIEPKTIQVSLMQEDYMNAGDEFALRLAVPDVVSGCYALSPLEYEASFIDPYYLDIKVKHYRRDLIETDNPAVDCPGTYSQAEAIIPLSKKDLSSRGTKQIKFRTKNVTEYYDLSFDNAMIQLKPQSMKVFKADVDELTQALKQDLNSASVVQLYVSSADDGDDLSGELKSFASARGLKPMDGGNRTMIIVKDEAGSLRGDVTSKEGAHEVGSIYVKRLVRGQNGVQERKVPLTVFAKAL